MSAVAADFREGVLKVSAVAVPEEQEGAGSAGFVSKKAKWAEQEGAAFARGKEWRRADTEYSSQRRLREKATSHPEDDLENDEAKD